MRILLSTRFKAKERHAGIGEGRRRSKLLAPLGWNVGLFWGAAVSHSATRRIAASGLRMLGVDVGLRSDFAELGIWWFHIA